MSRGDGNEQGQEQEGNTVPCPFCESPELPKYPHRKRSILRHLYQDHQLTQEETAEVLGCSRTTVRNWMQELEVERREYQYDMPEDELRKLYLDNRMSIEDIADYYGCSYIAVRNRLKKYNIELRSAGYQLDESEYETDEFRDPDVLRRLYEEEGLSKSMIAERCGVAVGTIQYWMNKHGIEARDYENAQEERHERRDEPYMDEEVLNQLYWDEGLTQREIAERFDVTLGAIQPWMDKYDIQLRYAGAHGLTYETKRGEYVRSSHERRIADWLYENGIDYEYEPEFEEASLRPDFLVYGDFVEYWGMLNREEYVERMHEKIQKYREAGIEPVNIFPYHLADLNSVLGRYT